MLEINFSPFPNLESERLLLRRIDVHDAEVIFQMRSNAEIMKYIPRPLATTTDDALLHISQIDEKINNNLGINWAITKKDNGEMIGLIGNFRIEFENYRAEIGYMLHPDFHGKGYISEAIAAAIAYGFNHMNLHSIEAIIDPRNTASAKALEKNGFVKEAHLRENEYFDGKFLDTVIYSILKSDHQK